MSTFNIRFRGTFLVRLVTLLLILTFALSACAQAAATPQTTEGTSATSAQSTQPQMDKVTMRLSWRWKAEFAPLVLAVDKGFFKKQNIDMTLLEGKGSGDVLPLVAQKQADFAYLNLTTVAIGIGKGMPVKVVAGLMGKNPSALAFFADQNIKKPKDLENHSIALAPGEAFSVIWPSFAKKWNIDTSKVQTVNLDPTAKNQAFLEGKVDVLPVYVNNELPQLRVNTKKQIDTLVPAEWGFNTIANGLITHDDTIRNNPDLVRRVVAATAEGYQYALDHPDEAVDAIIKRSSELASQPRDVLLEQVKATLDFIHSDNTKGKPIGWMSDKDWNNTLDLLYSSGATSTRLKNSDVYTNEFVPSK